ncbi:MAG: alpha-glucan family phosphorylase [Gemmataceae bacterium]|nr:alpha-glucan family phosphorylase [Gemmataceae bacterium]
MARSFRTFTVLPQLPERLQALHRLAYNLWWCWHPEAWELFNRVDSDKFAELDHSPVRLIGSISQQRIRELEHDDGFLAHLDRVAGKLGQYLAAKTWYQDTYGSLPFNCVDRPCVAYFSMEFGIHESVPVYSGGLGVLAGDHLKSASDLGIPLAGVGIMFREGYFRQYLNPDGWQQERYPENDFTTLPLIAEHAADGSPLLIPVPLPGRTVQCRVWRIQVGRIPLYLLDTNIPQNAPEDRAITAQLYGGDKENRIKQEIVLGVGGYRALRALGREPLLCHLNEGHSAFCALERIRILMDEKKLDFATARELVKAGTAFTTHTPVPAGNEVFGADLVLKYLAEPMASLGLDRKSFLALGRQNPDDETEAFGMTVLALKLANTANGVSQLHGEVSRKMWQKLWADLPAREVPISAITNGVHTRSWLSPETALIYDRYLGVQWEERPTDYAIWKRVDTIPDTELWRTAERARSRLVHFARERLKLQLTRRGAPPAEVAKAGEVLDPEALTIGFARRFATYKRGSLLFKDVERLARIVGHKAWPVQFIFAGKAHPHDTEGKKVIAEVVHMARRADLRMHVVFLEDYDMNVARILVQGCDVWLNNPRRPLEASGTSGMKVAMNGGLNCSVLDGWWVEGYQHDNGWAIGAGEEYADLAFQDDIEVRAIYELLEQEIVPTFYNRGTDGVPREWVRRMKRVIRTLVPMFNTNRMVQEYVEKCYLPGCLRQHGLAADGGKSALELAQWRARLGKAWPGVKVDAVDATERAVLKVGGQLNVTAAVDLNGLGTEDVAVQLFHGPLDNDGQVQNASVTAMQPVEQSGRRWAFRGTVNCQASGQFGYAVRVLPRHALLPHVYEPGLVTWG